MLFRFELEKRGWGAPLRVVEDVAELPERGPHGHARTTDPIALTADRVYAVACPGRSPLQGRLSASIIEVLTRSVCLERGAYVLRRPVVGSLREHDRARELRIDPGRGTHGETRTGSAGSVRLRRRAWRTC